MRIITILTMIFLVSCNQEKNTPDTPKQEIKPYKINSLIENTIDSASIMKHINILASDEFQGRFPSSIGEEKTENYLIGEMKKLGIKPANGDSYLQEFNVTKMTSKPNNEITVTGHGKSINLEWKEEYVAQTRKPGETVSIKDAELVFCGYGITAPEYEWNDFDGIDMSDKIAVVFVNDPGFATKDSALFTGNNMTYYGRWSYKYEEAARQNCLGLMIIHEDDAAGYPWEVVRNGWSGTEMVIINDKNNQDLASSEGWFNKAKASEIFEAAGYSFDEMKAASLKPDFKPIPLGMNFSVDIALETEPTATNNIVGILEGITYSDEYVIYMGHWDHYGVGDAIDGDSIYNGARDNASGCAAILEIAESFAKAERKPDRSIIFMFTGGEEQGLLGSKFYGANPLYPLNKTVACINIDGLNIWGKMNDIVQIGKGQSPDLDDLMDKHFGFADMEVKIDPNGQKGYFYRSDHFSLAKNGVPAIYSHIGRDHIAKGEKWATEQIVGWTKNVYHKPSDEVTPDWVMGGALVEMGVLYSIGSELANTQIWPKWSDKSEFKAIREESMKK